MATTYGKSPGGYLWAIAEPVAGTMLFAFIFSLAFRAPPMGTNFAMFYATGLLPFLMYMDLSQKISTSIRFSKALLFYPAVTFVDAIIARLLLNTMTQILVFLIVMSGITLIFDIQSILAPRAILMSFAMAVSLGFSIGILNCYLIYAYPAWERIWAILNRPMFIVSCILFLLETIPEPYRGILWYNPLVHVTGEMRAGFYPSYEADYVSYAYVFGISLICSLFGIILLSRYHREMINT